MLTPALLNFCSMIGLLVFVNNSNDTPSIFSSGMFGWTSHIKMSNLKINLTHHDFQFQQLYSRRSGWPI